ncbi:MAG: hypothetical protein HGA65_08560, partial [Oscillochloris sp.]|nr:hypothetical protein [Oscillochloris sp.]
VLIVVGVVAILNVWWAIPPVLLAGGGVAIYQRQRSMGRTSEAVQAGLWGVGLAVLLLLHFLIPGVLLLAGASLLLRGRELEADQRVRQLLASALSRRSLGRAAQPTKVTIVDEHQPSGETVRLR